MSMRIFLHVLKTSNEIRLVFPFDVKLESCTYSNYDLLEPPHSFVHSFIFLSLVIFILERHLEYISLPMVNNITILNASCLWTLVATHSTESYLLKYQVNLTRLELVATLCLCCFCTIMKS